MKNILLLLIRMYQLSLSVLLPSQCRFMPSCSAFAIEAIQKQGAFRGSSLAFKRILRCHRWAYGGWDPVP